MDIEETESSSPFSLLEPSPEAEYEARIANMENSVARHTTEFFSWRLLAELSGQLPAIIEKFGAITATSMRDCVALGTERGVVVVVDYLGRIKTVLGSQTTDYGAASAVAFSSDYDALVAGYSHGYVVLWDLAKSTTTSAAVGHLFGSAITYVHFIGISKHRYVSCSAAGYVFYHHVVRRLLTTLNTTQLSSPDTDPGIIFEVAALPYGSHTCFTDDMGLVAILTSASLTVCKTRHGVKQMYRHRYAHAPAQGGMKRSFAKRPFAGSACWLPALKLKHSAATETSFSHPMLAFSWGSNITVLELRSNENERWTPDLDAGPAIKLRKIVEWTAVEDVVLCRFIDADSLLFMTRSQRVFVVEVPSGQETEVCATQPGAIVGQPWVTLSTGTEAEPSYAQMVTMFKHRVFALCNASSVYSGRLLSWTERLADLAERRQYITAITLAVGLYTGQTGQIVVGLPRTGANTESTQHTVVANKLIEMIRSALKDMFDNGGSDSSVPSPAMQRALGVACIEACLVTKNSRLLFGEVFDAYLLSPASTQIYLETLEPFILSGRVTYLPPQILNAMIDNYKASSRLVQRLGELLMQLELAPGEFDVDRVLQSCRKYQLWRTFARVWLSLGDPVAPIISMVSDTGTSGSVSESSSAIREILADDTPSIEHEDETPATVMFEYLDMVIRGRYYPDGQRIKPQELAETYSRSVVELVFPPVDSVPTASSISKTYSVLLALLQLGTEHLLIMLKHVLEDPFIGYISIIVKPGNASGNKSSDRSLRRPSQVKSVPQIIVDTMFVLTSTANSATGDGSDDCILTARQIGLLSSFALTLYVTRYPLIFLPDKTVSEWAHILLHLDDPSTRAEREYAFELLFKLNPPRSFSDYIDPTRSAGFYRVLEYIYHTLEQYDKALGTYLDHSDYAYRRAVFSAMRELADGGKPKAAACAALVAVDAETFVDAVENAPSLDHGTVIHQLEDNQAALFAYMRALLDPTSTSGMLRQVIDQGVAASDERAPPNIGLAEEQNMVVYPFQSLVPNSSQPVAKFPQEYHEKYLELLCQFNPGQVLQYLKQHADDSTEPFRLSFVQKVCERYGAIDGLVWTLQRLGDFSGALDALLLETDKEMEAVKSVISTAIDAAATMSGGSSDSLADADRERLQDHLHIAAQRVSSSIQVCKAVVSKLGKDVAAQSEREHQKQIDSGHIDTNAAKVQAGYQGQVRSELCDLWLVLLRQVLGYLHSTNRLLDTMPVTMAPTLAQTAWQLVLKHQRWMLQNILDALIFVASPASSLISLRYIVQELMAPAKEDAAVLPKHEPISPTRTLDVAEIKHLLAVAVGAYKSEAQLMALTNILVDYDLFTQLARLIKAQKQGWLVSPDDKKQAASGTLACEKCHRELFVDRRQPRAMAALQAQIAQYFDKSPLHIVDLQVFEDPSSQWQWIKLRNAATAYDEIVVHTSQQQKRRTASFAAAALPGEDDAKAFGDKAKVPSSSAPRCPQCRQDDHHM
ncbi:hypothetical protein DL89DRAFT_289410 [Linderina pennispora]|uniref:Uncharacterized protein n=1 Tax=Linderina pennispora TaxID=61395 RepID=A0A1Y1WKQ9_9FUNG|nr:uncharacterized protein DL89DRAFT_289410 [Linderina pennispora]ORX73674.1 hypothetical protein DL89DRAFT_289410 [Linderina pennispora]